MNPARSTGSRRDHKGLTDPPGHIAALPLPGTGAEMLAPVLPAAASAGAHDRVSLTVRIDRAMHARLRALAARQQRTHQDIVEGALDAYLNVFATRCACNGSTKREA